jgi:hypothetical protein
MVYITLFKWYLYGAFARKITTVHTYTAGWPNIRSGTVNSYTIYGQTAKYTVVYGEYIYGQMANPTCV